MYRECSNKLHQVLMDCLLSQECSFNNHTGRRNCYCELLNILEDWKEYSAYPFQCLLIAHERGANKFAIALLSAWFETMIYRPTNPPSGELYKYCAEVIKTGDDVVSLLSYHFKHYSVMYGYNSMPCMMRRLMKKRLEDMDDAHLLEFKKHDGLSLADCVKMLHPDPRKHNGMENVYKAIIEKKAKGDGTITV